MALHFGLDELNERRSRLLGLMGKGSLDGLLIFRQETVLILAVLMTVSGVNPII